MGAKLGCGAVLNKWNLLKEFLEVSDLDLWPSDPKMGVACKNHHGAYTCEVSML